MENLWDNYKIELETTVNVNFVFDIGYYQYGEQSVAFKKSKLITMIYNDSTDATLTTETETFDFRGGCFTFLPANTSFTVTALNGNVRIFKAEFELFEHTAKKIYYKSFFADNFKKSLMSKLTSSSEILYYKQDGELVKKVGLIGVEQTIKNCIELIIIDCVKPVYKMVYNALDVNNKSSKAEKLTVSIYNYMGDNLYKNISLDKMAEDLFFSKSYVKTAFKKTTGKSVIQAFTELKIEEAKKMISNGESVKDIYKALSFNNEKYFSTVFKKATGLTPSEYKKSVGYNYERNNNSHN